MSRKMKDSGVAWLGQIPIDWNVVPLWVTLRRRNEDGHPDEQVLSLYREYGIVPKDSRDDNHNVTSLDTNSYKFVRCGDFVINKMKAWQGSMALSNYQGIVSPAYYVCEKVNPNVCSRYLHYLLRNSSYLPEYKRLSSGLRIGQWDLAYEDFKNIPHLIPPLLEQQRIADYLDAKCAAIDDVVVKTNESIEEYKKLKQAVITEVVTKGVRGKRPMKNSDIDWIDEIPKEWNTDKLKRILTERMESNDPVQTSERLSLSIDTGVTLYAEKTTNLDRFKEDVSQYKLAHEGDLVMNSMNVIVGAVGVSNYFGCVSPAYYTYYDNEPDHVTARYMDYVFRTKSLRALLYRLGKGIYAIDRGDGKVNTCRLKVSREDMRSLKLPLPSVEEQREIVQYLDKKREDIDTLISKKQQFIDELTAYKKSLIYEYVTGKKEVPA